MENLGEGCLHSRGLRIAGGEGFQCADCGEWFDMEDVERWVRAAEEARDEAYSSDEGEELAEIVCEEWQREVYRRRKVLYELRSVPRGVDARPEMILVSYNLDGDAYECRIFYKEPRPVWCLERVGVEADLDSILALRLHPDPNVRLVSGKIGEFHDLRLRLVEQDAPPLFRRVFYQSEF